jgi:hypothetical protein
LVVRQQLNDQSYQLAGGEDNSPLMLVLAHLVILAIVIGSILGVAYPDCVGRLIEAVAQEAVAGPREARVFRLEVSRLVLAPRKAGKLGHLGCIVVEAIAAADVREDAPGEGGADAGEVAQGIAEGGHSLGYGAIPLLPLVFQPGEVM